MIGGKHLSKRADFTSMVRGATPDVVLTGVELLATGVGDVVVVDVGGATTDVHSVVDLDPDSIGREVVATTRVTRTVEGDLGMRWSALTTVADLPELADAAQRRHDDPGFLPTTDAERDEDEAIARAAVGLALRRHAGRSKVVVSPEGRVVERTGKDLREVDCWSARAGCCATAAPASPTGSWPAAPAPIWRAAGSCRERHAWSSTPTTCWPRPACSPTNTRRRRTSSP